jgi:hypothetical protein
MEGLLIVAHISTWWMGGTRYVSANTLLMTCGAEGDTMLNGGATPLMASLEAQGEFTTICSPLIHNDLAGLRILSTRPEC